MGGPTTGARLAALALGWLGGVGVQLGERALQPAGVYAVALALGLGAVALACIVVASAAAAVSASVSASASVSPSASASASPRASRAALLVAVAGLACAGFGLSGAHASRRMAQALPAALQGEDLAVVGIVASLPQRGGSGLRFRFDVEQARHGDVAAGVPPRIQLGWHAGFDVDAPLTPLQQELRAGQRWRFTVRLKPPHGLANPHGFDHELALFEQGVRATGYVRDTPPAQRLDEAAGHPVERARQAVRDAIEAAVPDPRAAGVLAALAVGDQSAIDRDDWELFRRTGIAHLVSISGLHVTMFAWLAGLAVGAAWRRSARACLAMPAPLAARWGGLLAAAAYAVFAGWGVPAQRTVWMLAAVTVLHALGKRWPWPLALLAAAVVVTVPDPWALLQPGFWLSFVAVGLLMASGGAADAPAPPAGRGPALVHRLRGELRGQAVATLGLAPLTLVCFQQVSLVGFIGNLVAIPVVTLVVTPLALLGTLAPPLWTLGAAAVQALCRALTALSGGPGAVWSAAVAPGWAQAAGLAAAVLAVLPLPWRLRALALPLAAPLVLPVVPRPPAGAFELLAADVGQGSAVLVRTHRHLLVYDAGPQYSRDNDAGQRVLLPLLRALGETRIDRLVLSHRDTDHVGGARALMEGVAVAEVWSSLEPGHPLLASPARATRCAAGQRWSWDGVRFEVLQPPGSAYEGAARPNALSCVLKVEGDGGRVLLTGDIGREQEARLVSQHAERLPADVLLAPHHGSRTSSTPAFLDAVRPRVAVVQAGFRNRFGHPAPEVLDRYAERGIAVVATPACGAWRWPADAAGAGVCTRDAARRYWHHRRELAP